MRTTLLGLDLLLPTVIDILLLIISISVVAISLWLSFLYKDLTWFERSGSLMVLFSAIVEFRNIKLQQAINDKAAVSAEGIAGVLIPTSQPPMRQFIIVVTHIFIIIGTFVWGYGSILPINL